MTAVDPNRSLGALVADRPDLAREFERLGLDSYSPPASVPRSDAWVPAARPTTLTSARSSTGTSTKDGP